MTERKHRTSSRKHAEILATQLGLPEDYLGRTGRILGRGFRVIRAIYDESIHDWAKKLTTDDGKLSRLEHALTQEPPSRNELLIWARVLGHEEEFCNLMIEAGYLPEFPPSLDKFLSEDPKNLTILSRAFREMTGDRSNQGYLDIIKNITNQQNS